MGGWTSATPQDEFTAQRRGGILGSDRGQFDLKVLVDGEITFFIRGADVRSEIRGGRSPRDLGSECTEAIPERETERFDVEKLQGRGDVTLIERPSSRNNYTAIVRIADEKSGDDRYHVRLTWAEGRGGDRVFGGRRRGRGIPGDELTSAYNSPSRYDIDDREGELEFRGRIDHEVILYVRSDRVFADVLQGRAVGGVRFSFSQPLPARRLRGVGLDLKRGRGEVELIEEPGFANDYTTVIAIMDDRGGDDEYHFVLYWRR
jgi:hypothetical protein